MPSQVNIRPMQLSRLYNAKLHGFRSSGERTYNSDNENIYHPKFAWYAERSSPVDIILKSYHLIAFELVNPLIYNYFPSFEYRIFLKISRLRCRRLLRCDFVTSLFIFRCIWVKSEEIEELLRRQLLDS